MRSNDMPQVRAKGRQQEPFEGHIPHDENNRKKQPVDENTPLSGQFLSS
jgi:hypothetical protein